MKRALRMLLALAVATLGNPLRAQTNQEPFPTTLRSEAGAPISAAEYDDTIRALRNFFIQAEADYHLFLAGGTGLPATCDANQLWYRTDATSGRRLYVCESTDTWVLQGDGGGAGSLVLDLGDDGSDESTALAEIASTGDHASGPIMSEPAADKLLFDFGQPYPTIDGSDAGAATTHTGTISVVQILSHNTACDSITDGSARELCFQESDDTLWICEPTAGACDTAGEWKQLGGSGTWEGLTNGTNAPTTYTSNNTAETFTLNFESAWSTGSQFLVRQQTGDPTGGTFAEFLITDPSPTWFKVGDGTSGLTIEGDGTAVYRDDTFPSFTLWRDASTDALHVAGRVQTTKATDMGAGFGSALQFWSEDDTQGVATGTVGFERASSDDESEFVVEHRDGASLVEAIRVNEGGSVGFRGSVGLGSTLADGTCLAVSADRIYHDTDCSGTKGGGEEFIDQAGGGASLTVEEADGTPTVSSVTTIQFDSADGFTVTDETGGQVQIDLPDFEEEAHAAEHDGSGIEVSGETLNVDLIDDGDAQSATTASESGLEFVSGELGLVRGCADGELLQWQESTSDWACDPDDAGGATPVVVGTYDPDYPPDAADLFDGGSDEFDGGFEETWRWGNQNSATDTAIYDGATLATIDDDDFEDSFRWLDAPTAGTSFLMAAKMSITTSRTDDQANRVFEYGIGLLMEGSEGTPPEIATIKLQIIGAPANEITVRSSHQDNYARSGHTIVVTDETDVTDATPTQPIYLLLRWDATGEDLYFYYSWDGLSWSGMGSKDYTGLDPISVGRFGAHKDFLPIPTAHYSWVRTVTDATKITNLEVGQARQTGGVIVEEADGSPSVTAAIIQFNQANGFTVTDEGGNQVQIDFAGGGGGDSLEVEDGDDAGTFTAVDTTARLEDQGDINFTFSDGGAGGPDTVTATVRADSVALTTDTTGNYVAEVAAGLGLSESGSPAEGATATVSIDHAQTLAGNPALGADECVHVATATGGGLLCEGGTANTNEMLFLIPDLDEADTMHRLVTESATQTLTNKSIDAGQLTGTIADARVDGSLEADELVLAGDVDGAANANDLDEAAVEAELEAVLDLADLQEKDIDSLTGQSDIDTAFTFDGVKVSFDDGTAEARLELPHSATLPANCALGDTYWDEDADTDGSLYVCRTADVWKEVDDDGAGGFTSFDVAGDDGAPNVTITDGNTLQIVGGTNGIDTEDGDAGADTLTINLDATEVASDTWTDAQVQDIALGTGTSGNYVDDVTAGAGIAVTHTPAEGSDAAVALDYSDAGADPALGAEQCRFSNEGASAGGWVCEGGTADAVETRFRVTDPTSADKVITFPDAGGEVSLLGQTIAVGELAFTDFHDIGGTDDDVPESGDFGAGIDLEADGSLSANTVDGAELVEDAVDTTELDDVEAPSVGQLVATDNTTATRFEYLAVGTGLNHDGDTLTATLGTAIDTSEITDGTIDALDLDSDARSESCGHIVWEAPVATDEFTLRLPPWAGTMTRIDCEAFGGTSFTIKVCDGEDRGDDTCTTNILDATETTTLTCDTSGANDAALNSGGFAARDKITYVLTAVSGSVVQAEIQLTCRRD